MWLYLATNMFLSILLLINVLDLPMILAESNDQFVNQIRRLFELSVTGADVPHKLLDQAMAHLDAGGSWADSPITDLNESMIGKLQESYSNNRILQIIPLLMITMGRSEIFQQIFTEIKDQAYALFGHNILGLFMNLPVKAVMFDNCIEELLLKEHTWAKGKMAFGSERYALVLFFYIRLHRKLSGILEAPYLAEENTRTPAKSLVLLMRAMMKRVNKEFERFVVNHELEHYEMVRSVMKMDYMDTWKEVLGTVELGIRLSMAPLIGQEFFENGNFTKILQGFIGRNFAKLVIQIGDNSIDHLIKVPDTHKFFGNAVVFKQILRESKDQLSTTKFGTQLDLNSLPSEAQYTFPPMVIRNSALICHIFEMMIGRLLAPQLESILVNNEPQLQNKLKVMKTFLTYSVAQLQKDLSGSGDGSAVVENRANP